MERDTPIKFSTTPGTRDVLPPESTRLLDVQAKVLERFRMYGFREVVTPALEYSEVVEEPKLRDTAFKLFDRLPVYRRSGVGRGQSAEFHQAGVEVVGSTSPGEDAGTIALLVDTL